MCDKKTKIFIDGSAGTTGLRIYERLGAMEDIELIRLPEEERKSPEARKKAINESDVTFLCLPDDAARESVSLAGDDVIIIDTSTAHRTESDFAYGFPELSEEHREKIKNSKRIAVPGCHAGGFIALLYPLIENGFLSPDAHISCHSLTGYSGGGKKMIAEYEAGENQLLKGPRQYGLSQNHKHLKEMVKITGLSVAPVFCPIVGDFYSGMEVTVPLFASDLLKGGIEDIKNLYKEKYNSDIVKYVEDDEEGFLSSVKYSGKDFMRVAVYGNEDRIILVARYDNLGKGASGAAIQCMNIAIGKDEKSSLEL
ncbi:MAG: N-acetyl-gamma-glutamyl-phosphate reductase [Clostridia bacterium]|nr:N-acetyl-gamma-glutamyl-phosphate reductase [Clostridia bacterium]